MPLELPRGIANENEPIGRYALGPDDTLTEKQLQDAAGLFETDDEAFAAGHLVIVRHMPSDCEGRSSLPMLLLQAWGPFLTANQLTTTSATHLVRYRDGQIKWTDLNIRCHTQRPSCRANAVHFMKPGFPAGNWCLVMAEESQVHRAYRKAANLLKLVGGRDANKQHTQIDEIWLLCYPQHTPTMPQQLAGPLPVVQMTSTPPLAGSCFIVLFVRNLMSGFQYAPAQLGKEHLVGYLLIEPNMLLEVPACSFLQRAPAVETNDLLHSLGYRNEEEEVGEEEEGKEDCEEGACCCMDEESADEEDKEHEAR